MQKVVFVIKSESQEAAELSAARAVMVMKQGSVLSIVFAA